MDRLMVTVMPSSVKVSILGRAGRGAGGARGEIKRFTQQARLRMIKFLHSVSFEGGVLVTLTYPDSYPDDWRVYKRHLQEYRHYTELLWGRKKCVWKLEYQKRGAPHYHLFYLDERYIDLHEASVIWNDIVAPGNEAHRLCGVDVESVWGENGVGNVGAYVTKYISKGSEVGDGDEFKGGGRYWGKWNVDAEKMAEFSVGLNSSERVLQAVGRLMSYAKNGADDNRSIFGTTFLGACGGKEWGRFFVDNLEACGIKSIHDRIDAGGDRSTVMSGMAGSGNSGGWRKRCELCEACSMDCVPF